MSDLIRREDVIKLVNQFVFGLCKAQNDEVIKIFNKYVEKIPTAYDIDNVVEKLEENASRYTKKYNTPYGNNWYRDVKAISIHKAIEIVKNDGVGIETETIRDKAVKWNNNSSKRVPYEFIDYVEGKREIGVSDYVCEWKVFDNSLTDEPQWVYETTCGKYVGEEHTSNAFVYCPYCSKKIKVVE